MSYDKFCTIGHITPFLQSSEHLTLLHTHKDPVSKQKTSWWWKCKKSVTTSATKKVKKNWEYSLSPYSLRGRINHGAFELKTALFGTLTFLFVWFYGLVPGLNSCSLFEILRLMFFSWCVRKPVTDEKTSMGVFLFVCVLLLFFVCFFWGWGGGGWILKIPWSML